LSQLRLNAAPAFERKDWMLVLEGLMALGGVLTAGVAVSAIWGEIVRGGLALTEAAAAKIVEYFRGAEAVLSDQGREQMQVIEDLELRLAKARDELQATQARLAEVRQASAEVASEAKSIGYSAGAHALYK
jgi:hypothetical protein